MTRLRVALLVLAMLAAVLMVGLTSDADAESSVAATSSCEYRDPLVAVYQYSGLRQTGGDPALYLAGWCDDGQVRQWVELRMSRRDALILYWVLGEMIEQG